MASMSKSATPTRHAVRLSRTSCRGTKQTGCPSSPSPTTTHQRAAQAARMATVIPHQQRQCRTLSLAEATRLHHATCPPDSRPGHSPSRDAGGEDVREAAGRAEQPRCVGFDRHAQIGEGRRCRPERCAGGCRSQVAPVTGCNRPTPNTWRSIVEGLLVLCTIVWAVGYCIYRSGKREGSRKGYNVGRARGRRRR